jgi:hypothetical protein
MMLELRGTVCRCGRTKQMKQTFCPTCYLALPRAKRLALYSRFGEGYEEAYATAVAYLKGDDPHA